MLVNYHWLEHTHTFVVTEETWITGYSHPKMGTWGYFCLLLPGIKTHRLPGCVNGGAGIDTSLFVSNRALIPGYCDLEMIAKFILKAF